VGEVVIGDAPDASMTDPTAPGGDVEGGADATGEGTSPGSLIDVAAEAGDFGTLLAAVDAAGLTPTLDEGGPFTIVAPTDAAFEALPEGMVEDLLADIPLLTDILLYHVVDGSVPSEDVVQASLVPTVLGPDFKVSVDGDVFINDAQVVMTDIEADNGIIHVLDAVLIPPASITGIAVADPQFSTLVTALTVADLADTLDGPGPFTVFAPTNAAFENLPPGALDALLDDIPVLTDVLLYHVTDSRFPASDVVNSSSFPTLQGTDAQIEVGEEGVIVAGVNVIVTDIPAANGVIHVIDGVMIP
jgi:uncharacterized surface protein with fasciclin (FAS1) repeats